MKIQIDNDFKKFICKAQNNNNNNSDPKHFWNFVRCKKSNGIIPAVKRAFAR